MELLNTILRHLLGIIPKPLLIIIISLALFGYCFYYYQTSDYKFIKTKDYVLKQVVDEQYIRKADLGVKFISIDTLSEWRKAIVERDSIIQTLNQNNSPLSEVRRLEVQLQSLKNEFSALASAGQNGNSWDGIITPNNQVKLDVNRKNQNNLETRILEVSKQLNCVK